VQESVSASQRDPASPFSACDVREILRVHGWLPASCTAEHEAWLAHAAALLGPHAADLSALESLLCLIFQYDGQRVLQQVATHLVLSRQGARDVVRALANLLLDPVPLTSERFREIIESLKAQLDLSSRDIFHPLRLVLAGRAGEGELDRVILLLDEAAALDWGVLLKSARARTIEFCAALD
jgi:hypothetical protein